MRKNTEDQTLYRNYVRKWKFLIREYELVKQKRHPTFRFVADFYRFHQIHRQTFLKYDHRFRQSGADQALLPPAPPPFERMLLELGIKHRDTRPYRPQTNGKVERFWRTLNDDPIDGTTFASLAEFQDELAQALLYYNEVRPHQALEGTPPKHMHESCQRMTEHIQE